MKARYIEVMSPVADYRDVDKSSAKHAPRSGLADKRVLLLPAEKSSSPPFIAVLMKRMQAESEAKQVFTRNPQWPFFHPVRAAAIAPEIDAVVRECDLMVSAVAY